MHSKEINKENENVGRHVLLYMDKISKTSLSEMEYFNQHSGATVEQAIRLWIRLSLMITRRRPEIAVSSILNHILPTIGALPLANITRLGLNRLFNVLLADGKLAEAKRVFALCKQFLSWAENQGYITHSPIASMNRRNIGGKNAPPLARTLTDAEIWVFWHGLDMWQISEQCRWALRLCLLAAKRPDEVVRARRDEFHLSIGIWQQGIRNKSGREHILPISRLMKCCIEALNKANSVNSPWLVPSPRDPSKPLSKGAITQVLRRILRTDRGLGIAAFTTRDLRRTARSKLAAMDVPNDVARKIMNHSLEGIDRVYDTHDYLPQMKQALELLSSYIEKIISVETYHLIMHRYEGETLSLPERSLLYMTP